MQIGLSVSKLQDWQTDGRCFLFAWQQWRRCKSFRLAILANGPARLTQTLKTVFSTVGVVREVFVWQRWISLTSPIPCF